MTAVLPLLRRRLLPALLLIAMTLGSARAGMFGKDESLNPIGSSFQVPGEGSYRLGYKVSKIFILAGVWVSDDGYVLLPEGESGRYVTLNPELKSALQKDGLLPDPLPKYSLSFWDYLFGYSLWILIAGTVLWDRAKERFGQG